MPGPLAGVRIVEISMFQQGPIAGTRLADLGADVIKVEPKEGDPARQFMRLIGATVGLKGPDFYFESNNRNKRSIAIDLKNPKGKEIFMKLIETADVFLTNMSIDAPAKIGLGPDDLLKRNPRLIYAHASGWGRKGPDARELSFDYTGIARSGLMMCGGEKGSPPGQFLPGMGDEMGGLILAWGVTAALYAREKTGKGQVVDTSLMGSIINLIGLMVDAPAMIGQEYPRDRRDEAGNPMYNHYRCSDDKWIVVAHLQPERYWPAFCKALEIPELEQDPRFNTMEARGQNAKELVKILDGKFAARTRDEWMVQLKANGCICTPIQSLTEVAQDPQALANNYIMEVDHPSMGRIRQVGFPWDFSETPAEWRNEAPALGAHTVEILKDLCYTEEDIARMRESGVF
ncbi:MAG TPA: CoA transferase [Acidobacteriota bacterium]|nr:CoA transferase [Acidobacteriota bacterium]